MLCNLTLQLSLFKIFREADVVVSVIRFDSRSCIPAFPFSSTAMCFVFGYEDIHCVCVNTGCVWGFFFADVVLCGGLHVT